tara:strand:- start:706 stop:1344 length:639 start_codon:yes stop_codon:yes gene_type:complete
MIKNFSIIISNTNRTLNYINILEKNNIYPNQYIYLDNSKKTKISAKLKKKIYSLKTNTKVFKTKEINKKASKYILKLKNKNIIYSGYPGVIIKDKKVLRQKKIIHCHPGKLPEYKGSTTIYYSWLKEKKIFCSTLILNEKGIDTGKVLFVKKYPKPKNIFSIDEKYDNFVRSRNLLYVLRNFEKLKPVSQKTNDIVPYFKIHPVLRSIAFKK